MGRVLKAGLVSLFRRSGPPAPFRRRLGGCGAILCLHEIQDDPESELRTGCSPTFLAEIVNGLRRDGWDFVTLDEALRRVNEGAVTRPFAVLTFDDGYRDNLTRALPVLEKLQAPFTVYVPTGAVTREIDAWWLALRFLFQSHDDVAIECMDQRFSCVGLAAKIAAFQSVGRWVSQDFRRGHDLAPTFAAYGISPEALADAYFLNAEKLRMLANHPLVTIGAHTTSHTALVSLDEEEARAEMADNKTFLEKLLGHEVAHLAYPYGIARAGRGEREATLAQEVGFASAVTVRPSPIFPEMRHNPYRAPRISVRPNATYSSLYCRMSGLNWALKRQRHRLLNA